MKKTFLSTEIDEAVIFCYDKDSFCDENVIPLLKNSFIVIYSDIKHVLVYNGEKIKKEDRITFIEYVIKYYLTTGLNYSRKIIAQSDNVYFVY